MTRKLNRTGNSDVLVISRDMKEHLGLTDNRVEVELREGCITLTRPQVSGDDVKMAVAEYEKALQNLDSEGEEYTDEQFEADVQRAMEPLKAMAAKARESIRAGTARKFPE
jgi:antitoxin component of MazEF toxin-antitoxin module